MHPLSPGGLNLLLNFQKRVDLTGPRFLEGFAGKKGVIFFSGVGGFT